MTGLKINKEKRIHDIYMTCTEPIKGVKMVLDCPKLVLVTAIPILTSYPQLLQIFANNNYIIPLSPMCELYKFYMLSYNSKGLMGGIFASVFLGYWILNGAGFLSRPFFLLYL